MHNQLSSLGYDLCLHISKPHLCVSVYILNIPVQPLSFALPTAYDLPVTVVIYQPFFSGYLAISTLENPGESYIKPHHFTGKKKTLPSLNLNSILKLPELLTCYGRSHIQ